MCLRDICDIWSHACGINLVAVTYPSPVNILAATGPLDGLNGVLAQSYLPCGGVTPTTVLDQTYDDGEAWTLDFVASGRLA
jgi:hypothetical protein